MKRCAVSLTILLTLMAVCISSLFIIRSECRKYVIMADAAALAVQSGDTKLALECCDALDTGWEEFHNVCGLFVSGTKLDPLRDELAGLRQLIVMEHPEATAELERLRRLIEGIYEEELPSPWHIL